MAHLPISSPKSRRRSLRAPARANTPPLPTHSSPSPSMEIPNKKTDRFRKIVHVRSNAITEPIGLGFNIVPASQAKDAVTPPIKMPEERAGLLEFPERPRIHINSAPPSVKPTLSPTLHVHSPSASPSLSFSSLFQIAEPIPIHQNYARGASPTRISITSPTFPVGSPSLAAIASPILSPSAHLGTPILSASPILASPVLASPILASPNMVDDMVTSFSPSAPAQEAYAQSSNYGYSGQRDQLFDIGIVTTAIGAALCLCTAAAAVAFVYSRRKRKPVFDTAHAYAGRKAITVTEEKDVDVEARLSNETVVVPVRPARPKSENLIFTNGEAVPADQPASPTPLTQDALNTFFQENALEEPPITPTTDRPPILPQTAIVSSFNSTPADEEDITSSVLDTKAEEDARSRSGSNASSKSAKSMKSSASKSSSLRRKNKEREPLVISSPILLDGPPDIETIDVQPLIPTLIGDIGEMSLSSLGKGSPILPHSFSLPPVDKVRPLSQITSNSVPLAEAKSRPATIGHLPPDIVVTTHTQALVPPPTPEPKKQATPKTTPRRRRKSTAADRSSLAYCKTDSFYTIKSFAPSEFSTFAETFETAQSFGSEIEMGSYRFVDDADIGSVPVPDTESEGGGDNRLSTSTFDSSITGYSDEIESDTSVASRRRQSLYESLQNVASQASQLSSHTASSSATIKELVRVPAVPEIPKELARKRSTVSDIPSSYSNEPHKPSLDSALTRFSRLDLANEFATIDLSDSNTEECIRPAYTNASNARRMNVARDADIVDGNTKPRRVSTALEDRTNRKGRMSTGFGSRDDLKKKATLPLPSKRSSLIPVATNSRVHAPSPLKQETLSQPLRDSLHSSHSSIASTRSEGTDLSSSSIDDLGKVQTAYYTNSKRMTPITISSPALRPRSYDSQHGNFAKALLRKDESESDLSVYSRDSGGEWAMAQARVRARNSLILPTLQEERR